MTTATKGQLTGKHVLAILSVFFGVMIAVNTVFTVYAVRSFPGEQVEKSYLQGLHYNDVLESRARQAELGWSAQMGVDQNDGKFRMVLNDSAGNPIAGENILLSLIRPTSEDEALKLEFVEIGAGEYVAELPSLGTGQWDATATISREGETVFAAHKRLYL